MKKEKVILIDVVDPKETPKNANSRIKEAESLIETYGGIVLFKKYQKRQTPDYRYFVGKGKLEEVKEEALANDVKIIIVNNQLKSQQVFNIEWDFFKKDGIKVWDRIDLILKIFEKHATSSEAKLQIELAAIKHMGPRIFGMGMELSRQGGGIGTRGIGETNTEIMKRHLSKQEKVLREKIEKLEVRRADQRKSRQRKGLQSVAIVGYTNAGKSELMRKISKKNVKAKDELFATLDTRTGEIYLPRLQRACLISDTIGFIRDLPPELIQAFKSTLEEAIYSDLILHVIDFSDPERMKKMAVTNQILSDLGADQIPKIIVANKIDLMNDEYERKSFEELYKNYKIIYTSALTGDGLIALKSEIEDDLVTSV